MYLKKIHIKNWKSIENESIELENLMLLIGGANHGKSSIFSAILFFLGERNYRKKDKRKGGDEVEIEGKFQIISLEKLKKLKPYLDKNDELVLRITGGDEGFTYRVIKDYKSREIKWNDYQDIIKNIEVVFIPSVAASSKELTDFFYKKLLTVLDNEDACHEGIIEEIKTVYSVLQQDYASRGLQRNVIFNIARILSRESKKKKRSILGSTMILYEEPELYLHPQAERELYNTLIHLSKFGTQIYVCTHSSNFVGLKQYRSICIVRRDERGTKVFQNRKRLFSRDEVKRFNMNYWINPDRSELFFAKKVILVEGQTDKILLPYLAECIGAYKYEYSIIECGSKSTIPQFIRLLNGFRIPYTAVYDKDKHNWRTEYDKENAEYKNKGIQRSIDYSIGSYVEFENDIEEEIDSSERERKNYRHKPFMALKKVMAKDYVIPDKLKIKVEKIFK